MESPITPIAPARSVRIIKGGEIVGIGPLALTVVETPGHTPGGASWTWRSCNGAECLDARERFRTRVQSEASAP